METEIPKFKVGAQHFATGLYLYPPESVIEWVVPEGWNEKKFGKHFASHGPSTSFECLNKAAEDLMAEHKKKVAELRRPKPTANDEHFAKMEAMHLQMMNAVLEGQAENRRLTARLLELQEAREARDEDEGGKKKKGS